MTEATLKRVLVKALKEVMPGCVVFRHEDRFSGGRPDLSLTWRGTTSWVEVKYSRLGQTAKLSPLQARELDRLTGAGAPVYILTYRELGAGARLTSLWRRGSYETHENVSHGFDHNLVARRIREEHERRF